MTEEEKIESLKKFIKESEERTAELWKQNEELREKIEKLQYLLNTFEK